MAYTQTPWVNGSTPLSADNMNHIEQGIKDAHDLIEALFDLYHPVYSYFETLDSSFNPNIWGGTWVKEPAGLVHVSGGTNYPVDTDNEKDGGAESVALKGVNIPKHAHSYQKAQSPTGTPGVTELAGTSGHQVAARNHTHTLSYDTVYTSYYGAETVTPVDIMQPYKTVYRWIRIA